MTSVHRSPHVWSASGPAKNWTYEGVELTSIHFTVINPHLGLLDPQNVELTSRFEHATMALTSAMALTSGLLWSVKIYSQRLPVCRGIFPLNPSSHPVLTLPALFPWQISRAWLFPPSLGTEVIFQSQSWWRCITGKHFCTMMSSRAGNRAWNDQRCTKWFPRHSYAGPGGTVL